MNQAPHLHRIAAPARRAPSLGHLLALLALPLSLGLPGCATTTAPPPLETPLMPAVREVLAPSPARSAAAAVAPAASGPAAAAATPASPTAAAKVDELAPIVAPMHKPERRFSLVLTNASPETLFMALLNETPLSVAVDPSVKGPLSVTLKDVTLREALELLRELHNLEYKVIGRHILVSPAQMGTRIFSVDYPTFNRSGRSDVRVVSGSITGGSGSNGSGTTGGSGSSPQPGSGSGSGGGSTTTSAESSRISTSQRNDLWVELETTIKLLVGDKDGRSVIVSPQTGNLVVRAYPRELRLVAEYLDSTRNMVSRQVMIEAKVVEVQLKDSERTGINWAAFRNSLNTRASAGAVAPGGALGTTGSLAGALLSALPGATLDASATNAGAALGLAFQTSNFASVLEFLATQGSTQVLSSPRIATMNNQKAVLKVGTDDFFVTGITTNTSQAANGSTQTSPTITVQPFFSGISLDVTPHINAEGYITLHIHPAVSQVAERNKTLDFGTQGKFSLPLASSDINETDAVVRARDGQIIAIGGLMRQSVSNSDSGMPGAEGSMWGKLLGGQTNRLTEKRELVLLLKPTIIDPNKDDALRGDALQRLLEWTERGSRKPG